LTQNQTLTTDSPLDISHCITRALEEDIGSGDVTTDSIVPAGALLRGRIIAKQDGIVAGLEVANEVFRALNKNIIFDAKVEDGSQVTKTTVLAELNGDARALLTGERTALNFLGRMSGIATLTRQFVRAVEGTRAKIADTRQTTPGMRMLEKHAVLLGGGVNSRFGLDDGICVEPNHAALAGGLRAAVKSAGENIGHIHRIGAVVSTKDEIKEAIEAGATVLELHVQIEDAQSCVQYARELSPAASIEIGGEITMDNVRRYAESGADIIRVAALTQSVRAMAISFQIQVS